MKYSLDVYIISNNAGIRTAVKEVLPSKDHPSVWDGEYNWNEGLNTDNNEYFSAEIKFNIKADRDGFTNSVKALDPIIDQCLPGSYVREHRCYHDETPPKPCEEETILRA
jgi:hypothetical protein